MREFLSGRAPLWKAFWLIAIVGTVAITLFGYGVYIAGSALRIPTAQLGVIASILLFVPYSVFAVVSVWRCRQNTNRKVWTILAQAGVILYAAIWFFGLYRL